LLPKFDVVVDIRACVLLQKRTTYLQINV